MKQVCIIGGGQTYETETEYRKALTDMEVTYDRLLFSRKWKYWLGETLSDYDVLQPSMPTPDNAKYESWALLFDKIAPLLSDDAILVGHSLGGIFLAKYLNAHPTLRFAKVILVAAPYDDETHESLASFRLPEDMSKLSGTAREFALFHSTDDPVVPYSELSKYQRILPGARSTSFHDRLHLNTPTFPELLAEITPKS